VCVCVCVHTN